MDLGFVWGVPKMKWQRVGTQKYHWPSHQVGSDMEPTQALICQRYYFLSPLEDWSFSVCSKALELVQKY